MLFWCHVFSISQKCFDILFLLKHVIIVIIPEANREMIIHMYETVLNHTYKGKLEGKSEANDSNDYGKWGRARTTHLVYTIDDDDPIIITNVSGDNKGNHAEEQLIEELIKQGKVKEPDVVDMLKEMSLQEKSKLKLIIHINNSPCSQSLHECTGELINMLDNNVNVHLRLYVASLYNIRRESCKHEYHNRCINDEKHKANYKGLRKLMRHKRCKIKAFNKGVWKNLFKRTTGSKKLPGKYNEITAGNERSREDEDKRIRKDLKHIRDNELHD